MNTKAILSALNGIEEDLLDKYFEIGEKAKMKKIKNARSIWKKWICAAACFCLVIAAVAFAAYQVQGKFGDANVPREIVVEPGDKPTTGHKIGIKCLSFYRETTISIDAFMSQWLSDDARETIDGYPIFEVYSESSGDEVNSEIRINGAVGAYEKRFLPEELDLLVPDSIEEDVFDGHKETVLLDFGAFAPGDTVEVAFSYGFFYYKDNPYNAAEPDNSWCGMRRFLYFYVGEDGIYVSSNSIEDAISAYDRCNPSSIEVGHNPSSDICCAGKGNLSAIVNRRYQYGCTR